MHALKEKLRANRVTPQKDEAKSNSHVMKVSKVKCREVALSLGSRLSLAASVA